MKRLRCFIIDHQKLNIRSVSKLNAGHEASRTRIVEDFSNIHGKQFSWKSHLFVQRTSKAQIAGQEPPARIVKGVIGKHTKSRQAVNKKLLENFCF